MTAAWLIGVVVCGLALRRAGVRRHRLRSLRVRWGARPGFWRLYKPRHHLMLCRADEITSEAFFAVLRERRGLDDKEEHL